MFQKGNKMSKGRPKGSQNKRNQEVGEIAAKYNLSPFEVLMMVATNDWKGLGYDSATRTSFTSAGIEFEEPVIRIQDRTTAAKEACKYLYSQKQAVTVDVNAIHKMTDEEFEKFKQKTLEEYLNSGK
jgi:hypothetical protein